MLPYIYFFGISIPTYRICFFTSIIVASIVLKYNYSKLNLPKFLYIFITSIILVFGIMGAHLFDNIERHSLKSIESFHFLFSGGLTFHGGFIISFFYYLVSIGTL